jgi:hypothetical protein
MTILVQSFLNSATKLTTTATTATTVAQLKTLVNVIEGVSTSIMEFYIKNPSTTSTALISGTLGSYGVTTATTIYSSNTISTATNKVDRQLAKLELAQLRRQAGGDTSSTFYRSNNIYDIDLLADKYTSNTTTVHTTSTLVENRPWLASGSVQFDNTNWLSISTSTAFGFGTGDFTVEGWFYHTVGGANHRFFDFRSTEPQLAPMLGIGSINQIYYFNTGSNRIIGATMSTNSWTHIAISRTSGSTKLFVNGAQSGATYADTSNYGTSNQLHIGSDYNHSNKFVGNMSNIRVVKGTGLYTATFTVSTLPLTAVAGTQLLLNTINGSGFLTDSSTNTFTVTNTGGVISSAVNPF